MLDIASNIMASRKWNDEQLKEAFGKTKNVWEILELLKLKESGGNYGNILKSLKRLNLIPLLENKSPNKTFKYKYNEDVLFNNTAISYYLLGAFMTDGCISVTPKYSKARIISKDIDWIESIRDLICPELPLRHRQNCAELAITNSDISQWFIQNGCTPSKSLTLQLPNVPIEYLPDFIRGCLDGDGSLGMYTYKGYSRGQIYLCTASSVFANSVNELFHSLKINSNIHTRSVSKSKTGYIEGRPVIPKNDMYYINTYGKNSVILAKWAYYPNNPISMNRKNNIAQSIIQHYSSQ